MERTSRYPGKHLNKKNVDCQVICEKLTVGHKRSTIIGYAHLSFLDFGSNSGGFLGGLLKSRLGLDALIEVEFGVSVANTGDQSLSAEVAT